MFAGPLAGTERGRLRALLIVDADDEDEIRRRLDDDPWARADRLAIKASSRGTSSSGRSGSRPRSRADRRRGARHARPRASDALHLGGCSVLGKSKRARGVPLRGVGCRARGCRGVIDQSEPDAGGFQVANVRVVHVARTRSRVRREPWSRSEEGPGQAYAGPARVRLRRDDVAEVLEMSDDVHRAAFDRHPRSRSQAAGGAAVAGVLAGIGTVAEQVGGQS